jgi:membrane-bound serine protease (ClpP class)
MKGIFIIMVLFVSGSLCVYAAAVKTADRPVIELTVNDVIGPATQDYIERSLQTANQRRAKLIVIRLDTPGGLDSAMRAIIKNIINSAIPVVSYVAPAGARAASAGTYILYASHVAAMAPGTNLGAATPVKIGGIGSPGKTDKEQKKQETFDAGKQKAINDAVAYIRGLAQLHGRNQDWAEKAVREAASLPASDALKLNVVDVIAPGMGDLLRQLDGREVVVLGEKQVLQTAGLTIEQITPDWRSKLLSVITNPNVAYILMLIGIYGLIFEFSNPGAIVPGTVGAISLILALYSFQLLPINYAGMGLILLGIALMVGEAYEPSFGMLGIGGIVAFVFGSIILMDTHAPGFSIELSVIITFAIISALMFIFVIGMALKARRKKVVSGMEELVGAEATVENDFQGTGRVSVHSESWKASSAASLHKGQSVKVTRVKGLTLEVEPLEEQSQQG